MIIKEMIQNSIRDQFGIPDNVISQHLKVDRWVLKPRLTLCEMIETYRYSRGLMYAGDRDNDETFIAALIGTGLEHRVLDCPFEYDKTQQKMGEYSLRLSGLQEQEYNSYRKEKDWKRQEFLANCTYTGLLYSYPDFRIKQKYNVKVLKYDYWYQPNQEWLDLNGQTVTIAVKDVKEDPWIECLDASGKTRILRKNFLFTNIPA